MLKPCEYWDLAQISANINVNRVYYPLNAFHGYFLFVHFDKWVRIPVNYYLFYKIFCVEIVVCGGLMFICSGLVNSCDPKI